MSVYAQVQNNAKKDDIGSAISQVEHLAGEISRVRDAVKQVIYGQDAVIDQALVTLLAGGHLLLVGAPGLGKTRLVETLGAVFGLDTKRVQCTPDLMPADILGSEILDETPSGRRAFRFIEGPVFCQFLMADEINRASPRTQSALLQAMQERRISIGGAYRDLPRPFHVLATQNPLEQEGTYPLPEAQLDRFFMQVDISYPDLAAEREILVKTTGVEEPLAPMAMASETLIAAHRLIRSLPVPESVAETILRLVRAGRPETTDLDTVRDNVSWGPGPRASQAMTLGVRARAVIDGRLVPSVDDVLALAVPVLKHRMGMTFAARADGLYLESVIARSGGGHRLVNAGYRCRR